MDIYISGEIMHLSKIHKNLKTRFSTKTTDHDMNIVVTSIMHLVEITEKMESIMIIYGDEVTMERVMM
jgi:hypothetical protein